MPCFKYADSEDVILFTSRNIHYLVDKAGQFNENYYGMKHELIECIQSEQVFVDLNDVLYVLSAWGSDDANADFDDNGLVDVNDVLILLSQFGEACP